jgi:hypothetical protein
VNLSLAMMNPGRWLGFTDAKIGRAGDWVGLWDAATKKIDTTAEEP